jgi:hypothetical protein
MIDVSELITDPDFAQDFIVHRSYGHFDEGGWIEDPEGLITMTGVVTVMSQKELAQMPEADRVKGAMIFYSTDEIKVTRNIGDQEQGTSDKIDWRGDLYRIFQISTYADYGYYKAVGTRIKGD